MDGSKRSMSWGMRLPGHQESCMVTRSGSAYPVICTLCRAAAGQVQGSLLNTESILFQREEEGASPCSFSGATIIPSSSA
jgi:hypothetical protein